MPIKFTLKDGKEHLEWNDDIDTEKYAQEMEWSTGWKAEKIELKEFTKMIQPRIPKEAIMPPSIKEKFNLLIEILEEESKLPKGYLQAKLRSKWDPKRSKS